MLKPADFAQAFRARFGAMPRLFRAPGRVNLIGEHTDYNSGLVMPAAIQFETQVAIAPRTDRRLQLHSDNLNAGYQMTLPKDFERADAPPRAGSWSDYAVGVAWTLGRAGLPVTGADLLIQGSVPLGSGLSSSAALEVAVAQALLGISGTALEPLQIAQLCQRAENEFVGARCGLMDQFASVFGQAGRALYFDCRSLEHAPIPLGGAALVVCNSMVHHQLANGEYNRRREQCEAGVRALAERRAGIQTLRDVELPDLLRAAGTLDPVIYRRCRHVLSENARVAAMRDALEGGRLVAAGQLMQASHTSLRDDYEVSCAELDLLVTLALQVKGVYGARMTGGGFGGCTVNLVRHDAVETMMEYVSTHYERGTGRRPDIYRCEAADGAGALA
jgi:galactokinase